MISDSIIVNEITYGEASSGAPIVQGASLHEGQRYAKSAAIGNFRRGGRSREDADEQALRDGKDELNRLAMVLKITDVIDRAYSFYQLARIHHFQRPKRENAAICLYIACRQTPGKMVMLIDFADQLKCNVFDLGNTYKAFVKRINLEDALDDIPIIEIEPLLLKYARRLEFGEYAKQVANDAALIISRMDRDWIKTGRQPAALCGSCLILAARMNNFRRTVREVVLVVKAGEVTIHKRLDEFRRTEAGRMTVAQFRQYGDRFKGQEMAQPPIMYERFLKEKRREHRKRKRDAEKAKQTGVSESPTPSEAETAARVDADGFAIPALPARKTRATSRRQEADKIITPDLNAAIIASGIDDLEEVCKRRKRARRADVQKPLVITPEDLRAENELEQEIGQIVDKHLYDDKFELTAARARKIADQEIEKQRAKDLTMNRLILGVDVPDDEIIGEDEFEDDPEVKNCLLTEREIQVKERIWVTHNWQWLQDQQEKLLNKELEMAMGKKKKKKFQKRDADKISESPNDGPNASPADATARMIEKRKKKAAFSKHLDYDKLRSIYSTQRDDTSSVMSESADDDDAMSTISAANDAIDASSFASGSRAGTVEPDDNLLDPMLARVAATTAKKSYTGRAPSSAPARKNGGGLATPGPSQATQTASQLQSQSPTAIHTRPGGQSKADPMDISDNESSEDGSDDASDEGDAVAGAGQLATPNATQSSQRKPPAPAEDEEIEEITDDEEDEVRPRFGSEVPEVQDDDDELVEDAYDYEEETYGMEVEDDYGGEEFG